MLIKRKIKESIKNFQKDYKSYKNRRKKDL